MDRRWSPLHGSLFLTGIAGAAFIVAIALLYGSTLTPNPRDGVQPVVTADEAYYAVLGADLATTGTETRTPPSGFSELPGLPPQTWYHWGETWLASSVITVFGTAPLAARYYVVLPVLMLAAAALTGTFLRRMAGTVSRLAYVFGFVACLFLAPAVWIRGPGLVHWAVGLLFGIDVFGLAAVAVLLGLYSVSVLGKRKPTWALASFVGSAVALILPAHFLIAALAVAGAGGAWAIRMAQSAIATRRLPMVSPIWRRTIIATGIALIATLAWGLLTGHGLGIASPPSVSPFNATWRDSVAITALGAGIYVFIPIMWLLARNREPLHADVYLGTMALLLAGAIAWGALLGAVPSFYLFFGAIAVFATPVAVIASWGLLEQLQRTKHVKLAFGAAVLCVIQLEWGVVIGAVPRLQASGPHDGQPIPVSLLAAIKQLPPNAKLAYACGPFEEASFVEPSLIGIDAATNHRVVPMCFEEDLASTLVGATPSIDIPAADFIWAPQRALYADAAAHPSEAAVAAFLKGHGIEYIFADADHPNTLVPDAVPLAQSGMAQVLVVP